MYGVCDGRARRRKLSLALASGYTTLALSSLSEKQNTTIANMTRGSIVTRRRKRVSTKAHGHLSIHLVLV